MTPFRTLTPFRTPSMTPSLVTKLDHSVEISPKSPDLNLETQHDINLVRYS